jgi:hypothetical protein
MKTLKLFIDPWLLLHTPRSLLTQFLNRFVHLLPSEHTVLNLSQNNGPCHFTLSETLLNFQELPPPIIEALFTVESLATDDGKHDLSNTDPEHILARFETALQHWLAASTQTTAPTHSACGHDANNQSINPTIHESTNPSPSVPGSRQVNPSQSKSRQRFSPHSKCSKQTVNLSTTNRAVTGGNPR